MNQPLYHTIPAPASIVSNSGIIPGISDDNTLLKRSAFFNQKIRLSKPVWARCLPTNFKPRLFKPSRAPELRAIIPARWEIVVVHRLARQFLQQQS